MARRAGCDRMARHPTSARLGRIAGATCAGPAASGFPRSAAGGVRRCRERADAHGFRGCARSAAWRSARIEYALAVTQVDRLRRTGGAVLHRKTFGELGNPVTSTLCASNRACSNYPRADFDAGCCKPLRQFITVGAAAIHAQPQRRFGVVGQDDRRRRRASRAPMRRAASAGAPCATSSASSAAFIVSRSRSQRRNSVG